MKTFLLLTVIDQKHHQGTSTGILSPLLWLSSKYVSCYVTVHEHPTQLDLLLIENFPRRLLQRREIR